MLHSDPAQETLRPFLADRDAAWLHGLWHRTLDQRWAISLPAMLSVLSATEHLLMLQRGSVPIAFFAASSGAGNRVGVLLFLVEPAWQRQGIGTRLWTAAEQILKQQGAREVTVGAGDSEYFWPGIPQEQDRSWRFFAKCGFDEQDAAQDLARPLADFRIPDCVSARQLAAAVTMRVAAPARRLDLQRFEDRHFPAWADFFRNEMHQGTYENILFAQDSEGRVLGTVLMRHDVALPWLQLAAKCIATLNMLGVAPEAQGRGIGMALTAAAMEHLQQRGCCLCLIQWTGLADWYGKLGALPWATYRMIRKVL